MQIAVIGGEDADPGAVQQAEEVGRELARRGITLVCGGSGGVMLGACRGARGEGGHTIGILPGRGPQESPPNPFVEFAVYTGLGYARNSLVVLSADAVIAIDGAYGTLSEMAFALMYDIPLIGLETWDFTYHGHDHERITRVRTAQEGVERAVAAANAQRGG